MSFIYFYSLELDIYKDLSFRLSLSTYLYLEVSDRFSLYTYVYSSESLFIVVNCLECCRYFYIKFCFKDCISLWSYYLSLIYLSSSYSRYSICSYAYESFFSNKLVFSFDFLNCFYVRSKRVSMFICYYCSIAFFTEAID